MGMTAHVIYEAIDERLGTISPDVHRLIRSSIGFDGLLMTMIYQWRHLAAP